MASSMFSLSEQSYLISNKIKSVCCGCLKNIFCIWSHNIVYCTVYNYYDKYISVFYATNKVVLVCSVVKWNFSALQEGTHVCHAFIGWWLLLPEFRWTQMWSTRKRYRIIASSIFMLYLMQINVIKRNLFIGDNVLEEVKQFKIVKYFNLNLNSSKLWKNVNLHCGYFNYLFHKYAEYLFSLFCSLFIHMPYFFQFCFNWYYVFENLKKKSICSIASHLASVVVK